MRKVIHLLPYDGIGGAEAAARSMADAPLADLDFHLHYLFPQVSSSSQRGGTNNPFALIAAVRSVLREKPDLLIVSLWRSCIAGLLVKLLRPRTRLVVLIHNSVDAHFLDFVFTRWAMVLAVAVWADSDASIRKRFRRRPRAPLTTIPFLAQRLAPLQSDADDLAPTPHFVFWGRLAAQKNLPLAFAVFQGIRQAHPDARYTVIGPDSGELESLRARCTVLGIEAAVEFAGPMNFDEIRDLARSQAFYLQTSDYEGMAMSVVESMQLGLVPVVTPVGEVGSYCRAGHNAVIVDSIEQAVTDVLGLLADPPAYRTLRTNAIATWQGKPLYRDAVAAECRGLTNAPPPTDPHGSAGR